MYRGLARDSFATNFYGWPHADRFQHAYRAAGFRVVGHLVCPEHYTSSIWFVLYQHECASLLSKGHPKRSQNPIGDETYTGNKLYRTQKLISALLRLVEVFSPLGSTVLALFTGSGSSLVAAQRLGAWLHGHRTGRRLSRHHLLVVPCRNP